MALKIVNLISAALSPVISHQYNSVSSRLSMRSSLIVLDGTARGLNARFNLAGCWSRFGVSFYYSNFLRKHYYGKQGVSRDWLALAESLPRSFHSLLEQMQSGDFGVRIKDSSLERSINRLVYGMCTSALLLASALLWINQVPPAIRGVSVLGAAGYLVAAFLATRVLWRVRRLEKHKDD